eukprot:198297_1
MQSHSSRCSLQLQAMLLKKQFKFIETVIKNGAPNAKKNRSLAQLIKAYCKPLNIKAWNQTHEVNKYRQEIDLWNLNDESTKQASNHNTQQSQSQKRALRARAQQAEFDKVDEQELSDSDDDLEEEEDEFNLTYSISPKKEKSSITKKHKSSIAMPPLPKNKSTELKLNC